MSNPDPTSRLPKLTGSTDYAQWALEVKAYARFTNSYSLLTGTRLRPSNPDPKDTAAVQKEQADKVENWENDNEKTIGLIQ